MIREIEIEGFKSIDQLKLELGRVTVLIGENGCGKSNILEAIAFASAAYEERLDHEFLASRGIRSTEPRLMRPAFPAVAAAKMGVRILVDDRPSIGFLFKEKDEHTVPGWVSHVLLPEQGTAEDEANHEIESIASRLRARLREELEEDLASDDGPRVARVIDALAGIHARSAVYGPFLGSVAGFLVFSPENTALRTFEREGQILPIGINGDGLFAHLRALDRVGKINVLEELNRRLSLIGWFSGFEIPSDLGTGERRLSIRDRYLASDAILDQRSANEGFLFLLFYYTLLLSPDTPTFFAIDNIDASLNPRLCARLMSDVVELAKQQDKQIVVTTHNPAVLDGLDLADDEQRLVVVSRTQAGATRVRRVRAPEPIDGAPALRLSEAFLRGFLGGLPDNF